MFTAPESDPLTATHCELLRSVTQQHREHNRNLTSATCRVGGRRIVDTSSRRRPDDGGRFAYN